MNILTATTIPLQKTYGALKVLEPHKKIVWKKLAISTNEEIRFIPFDDILYCKSTNNYTTIYTVNGKSYLCSKTLKDIESRLPADSFFRIHHSYVVNVQCITSLKKQTAELEINSKLLLPISRSKKAVLYELFNL